jgi:hypothetical protein
MCGTCADITPLRVLHNKIIISTCPACLKFRNNLLAIGKWKKKGQPTNQNSERQKRQSNNLAIEKNNQENNDLWFPVSYYWVNVTTWLLVILDFWSRDNLKIISSQRKAKKERLKPMDRMTKGPVKFFKDMAECFESAFFPFRVLAIHWRGIG